MIKQLSILWKTKPAAWRKSPPNWRRRGVDIRALSVADTTNFGILRLIVDKPDEAERILREAGLTVSLTGVIAVGIPDQPGGFAAAMRALADASIDIEYMYAFISRDEGRLRHPAGGRQCRRCSGSREKRHPVVGRRQGIFHVTLQTPAALETTRGDRRRVRRSPCSFIAPCLAAEGCGGRTADDVPPKFRGRRLLSLIVGLDGHALAVFRKEDKAGLSAIAFRPPPHWSQIRILITIRRFLSPTVQIRLLHGLTMRASSGPYRPDSSCSSVFISSRRVCPSAGQRI